MGFRKRKSSNLSITGLGPTPWGYSYSFKILPTERKKYRYLDLTALNTFGQKIIARNILAGAQK